jgi:RND family efflux transporter MFP subunit
MRRIWIYVALAALLTGCAKEAAEAPGKGGKGRGGGPVAVRTARVERRDIAETLRFTGEIESPVSVELHPRIQGRLERIHVTEGVEVKTGQVIAEMDRRELEARLALAEAQVRQAEVAEADRERERRRLEALFAQDVATEQARDAAVTAHESAAAALAQAKAQRELAKVNLDEATLVAPMDGVVSARRADPGAMVGPNTPLARIVQMDPLRLMLAIPARLLPMLEAGQTQVVVESDVYPGQSFAATVNRVFPAVDPATRTLRAEVLLENPKEEEGWRFRPGMYATARLTLATSSGALVVPAASIVRALDRRIVYVASNGTVRALDVRTGIRSGPYVEILEGLAEGDEYVAMGQNKLTDGASIERVAAPGAQPAPKGGQAGKPASSASGKN